MAEVQLGKRKRQPEPMDQQSTSDSPLFLSDCNASGLLTNAPVTPSLRLAQKTDSRDLLSGPTASPSPSIDRPFRDRQPGWQEIEEKALVEFILLYGNGDSWPATKDLKYWDSAAKFIHERSGLQMRSAHACRSRTSGAMRQKYKSPKIAEEQMANRTTPITISNSTERNLQDRAREALQDDVLNMENIPVPIQVLPNIANVTSDLEVRLMSQLFSSYANRYFDVSVPVDFIPLALNGMKKLKDSNKPNVIYDFTKAMSLL